MRLVCVPHICLRHKLVFGSFVVNQISRHNLVLTDFYFKLIFDCILLF
jgi:hypothetical protein